MAIDEMEGAFQKTHWHNISVVSTSSCDVFSNFQIIALSVNTNFTKLIQNSCSGFNTKASIGDSFPNYQIQAQYGRP